MGLIHSLEHTELRAVDEVKSSQPLAVNCITDQCESQADESMPPPKQYNHVGFSGFLKLHSYCHLSLLKVSVCMDFIFIYMQSENIRPRNKQINEHGSVFR